ncbi:MAG: hypothetical protein CVU50_04565 [Candidatus Cloacimonetes bacterium HGW-Cloacimonetes-3]|jgi:hypothetical protein|nr:MAG: hypothetical protein CVU50_04565 [Candidatus Cloacimonetes bacterium HGW-Cloacimonetes-3]
MLSVCGVNCATDCRAYEAECKGCEALQGKVSWAEFYGKEECPIYACVKDKKLHSCGECGQAPCKVWYDTRNPDASDIEFSRDISSRLANLTSN